VEDEMDGHCKDVGRNLLAEEASSRGIIHLLSPRRLYYYTIWLWGICKNGGHWVFPSPDGIPAMYYNVRSSQDVKCNMTRNGAHMPSHCYIIQHGRAKLRPMLMLMVLYT
jgi:hypothetical protein